MMQIYFVTSNDFKFSEYSRLFSACNLTIVRFDFDITELQTLDVQEITRNKVIVAYSRLNRPLIVEHTSLSLEALGGLPEGITKPFWGKLKDHICEIGKALGNQKARMTACLGYCDGKEIWLGEGIVEGSISDVASSTGSFHLDRVFVPDGESITLSEMSDSKRDGLSPRKLAVERLTGEAKLSS